MRTKLEILTARAAKAREELERMEAEIRGLHATPCNVKCSGCGKQFETEADFAGHYVIPNESRLNLGECPDKGTCRNCGEETSEAFCSKACQTEYRFNNPFYR